MTNYKLKFVKSAAALALGASVITSAVVAADTTASAKTTYKVSNGKLVNAKTKKAIKGYKSYKSVLYKDGKKFTGLYSNRYYKNGVKATGTYKNTYYVKGVKKVTTGTYAGAYYVNGVKKVTTGTYASAYYVNGVKKVTTGTYNNAYYVKGVKKVTTGTYSKAYYVKGKKVVATGLYQSKYYVDGVLNVVPALFEGKLYDGSELNKGLKEFNGKTYFDADLANDTYKDANGVEKAYENGVEVGAKVKSVEAINAKQVKVTFNKSVLESSAVSNTTTGAIVAGTISVATVDGTTNTVTKAEVDGKTITYTLTSAISGRNVVKIDNLTTTAKEAITKYDEVLTFDADTKAPEIASVTKTNASTAKVTFSEPISSIGTLSYTYADGTTATVTPSFNAGDDYATLDLSGVTAGKPVTVTIIGAQDQAGNLLTPNPATFTVTKADKDGVAPTVASITQTGGKELTLKFSEELISAPTVTVGGTPYVAAKSKTDSTVYTVTTTSVLDGATTVAIPTFTDASGEAGTAYSKVYTFNKDAVAPKVTSTQVVADNGTQYLEITFDKNVDLTAATVKADGEYTKDYVTKTLAAAATNKVDYKDADTSKKVIRVALKDLLGTDDLTGASYSTKLTLTGVASESGIGITSASSNFTRVADTTGTDATAVVTLATTNAVVQSGTDNNIVTVQFSGNVDPATATNVSNYTVAGATVEKATVASATTDTVTLILKANSNTFSGLRNVTVANVKALNGTKPMATQTVAADLKENVVPTVKSASLTNTKTITLTFSEKVNVTDNAFDVYVGGTKLETATNTTIASGAEATTVTLTLTTDLTAAQLASGIVVKPATGSVVKDASGNASDFTSMTVAQ